MATIGIISALWVEAQKLRDGMRNLTEHRYAGMTYYEGDLGRHHVVLSVCSVGKVNAAIHTQLMIDHFPLDCILHTGVAGSMDSRVGHGDLVVADSLTYYDVRPAQLEGLFPHCRLFPVNAAWSDRLAACANGAVHRGLIISGDDFISEPEKKAALKERFPQALCVEMEGCSIAHTAYVNQVPVAVVRCISDLADGAATEDYERFEQLAADRAAGMVLRALEEEATPC